MAKLLFIEFSDAVKLAIETHSTFSKSICF